MDVSDDSGPLLRAAEPSGQLFEMDSLAHDMTAIDEEIILIIAVNAGNGAMAAEQR